MKLFNPKIIILLGRPGCGKGTQAKLLIDKFNFEYFGSGEALRKRQEINDYTGKKIAKVITGGDLVPSFVIIRIWIDALEKFKQKKKFNGLLLDGAPRKIMEAKILDEALNWYQWQKDVQIILIDISEKESFERLTKRRICRDCKKIIPYIGEFKKIKNCDECGGLLRARTDDKPAAIKKRLTEFKREVVPVLNYYKKQGRLIKINGVQSIENVFKDILKYLKAQK
jgi:adenylate kinase